MYIGGYLLINIPYPNKASTVTIKGIYDKIENNVYKVTRITGLYNETTGALIPDAVVNFLLDTSGNYVAKNDLYTLTIKSTDEVVIS